MANYIYFRVSTDAQDFAQQRDTVFNYLRGVGINPGQVEAVTEKVSGTVSHKERHLAALLSRCKNGDSLFVSELSRLGRCMADLFAIVTSAANKGVKLVQCKDGSIIEAESIGGKALLFALSLAAEIEVQNIRQRTRAGMAARRAMIESDGGFMSKSGRWCTKFGNPTGDNSAATQAAAKAATDRRLQWYATSPAFAFVKKRIMAGATNAAILEEFAELHASNPDIFSTREGACLSKGVLSRWRRVVENGQGERV